MKLTVTTRTSRVRLFDPRCRIDPPAFERFMQKTLEPVFDAPRKPASLALGAIPARLLGVQIGWTPGSCVGGMLFPK